MAAAAANNTTGGGGKALIDFDRMTGRGEVNKHKMDTNEEDALMADALGIPFDDGPMDLEVKDWQPHKPKPSGGYIMQDPKKYPRFPIDKNNNNNSGNGTAPPDEGDQDVVVSSSEEEHSVFYYNDYHKAKDPVLVDMGKMRGRSDDHKQEETALVELEATGGRRGMGVTDNRGETNGLD